MKYLILILLLSSCYTKNQAIKRFCSKDTSQVTITIHDTIVTDSTEADTLFNDNMDSVFIIKNNLEIRYVKTFGKVYIQGKCKPITIYYEKKVLVKVPVECPKLVWYKQFGSDYWFILPLLIFLFALFVYVRKILNN